MYYKSYLYLGDPNPIHLTANYMNNFEKLNNVSNNNLISVSMVTNYTRFLKLL